MLSFAPEMVIGAQFVKQIPLSNRIMMYDQWYWRHVMAFGGASAMSLCTLTSLLGYQMGTTGMGSMYAHLTYELMHQWTVYFTFSYAMVFMFLEWRRFKRVHGIREMYD